MASNRWTSENPTYNSLSGTADFGRAEEAPPVNWEGYGRGIDARMDNAAGASAPAYPQVWSQTFEREDALTPGVTGDRMFDPFDNSQGYGDRSVLSTAYNQGGQSI